MKHHTMNFGDHTRDTFPEPADGLTVTCECRDCPNHLLSEKTVLAVALVRPMGARESVDLVLAATTRGFVAAGSCLRWQEARVGVTWTDTRGAIQGQSWIDNDEGRKHARAQFEYWRDRWTKKPQIEPAPGPWTIGREGDSSVVTIDSPTWGAIATVVVKVDDEPSPQGEANAQLIVSARVMLEALQTIAQLSSNNSTIRALALDAVFKATNVNTEKEVF